MNPLENKNKNTGTGKRYACLVNRTRVIDTLEKKANATGFRYILPSDINTDFRPVYKKTGKFLRYDKTEPFELLDVDRKVKKTVKTSYYLADKVTPYRDKKAAIGVWINGLAGSYHGKKSSNWTKENLTLQEIIDTLNAGYAIAPGFFNPPPGESIRTAKYCEYREFILFDGDEWTPERPAPADIPELIKRYPDIPKDFYWIGESISSRSSLKPELRCRLMLVLPTPIRQGEDTLWQTVIDAIVAKYPFIARGVGIDKVRLSFGNARLDCENRILDGIISEQRIENWKQTADEKQAQAELDAQAEKEQKERQAQARQQDQKVRTELQSRGYSLSEQPTDPIVEFCKADPATLLTNHGIATHLQGNEWNYTGSSAGRSLELVDGIIKPFSNSAQSASPADDPTSPVNAHRYIAFIQFGLDMTKQSDKRQLRCELADLGYGTAPALYKKIKRQEKILAVREGLKSPLSLRPAAPPLPTEKERINQSLNTLQENSKEIAKAFSEKNRIIAVAAGTGEGKTENAIAYAVDGGELFMTLNSIPLAEQVQHRFTDAETNAFLWRSRRKGYTDDIEIASRPERIRLFQNKEILCIKPELIDAAEEKGLQPQNAICNQCEVQNECDESGYLSQKKKARKTQVLCVAMPKAFTDPASQNFYTDVTLNKSNNLINVIDEAKTHDLFITCPLSKQRLQEWVTLWKDEALSEFATQALTLLEIQTEVYAVAELVNELTPKQIEKLSYQASRYNVAYEKRDVGATCRDTGKTLANHSLLLANSITAYVALDSKCYEILLNKNLPTLPPVGISDKGSIALTPQQTFKLGIFKTDTIQDINNLPSTYRSSDWTPFQQLSIFAKRYKRREDAPIEYVNDELSWVIPPMIHPKIKKLICMSATLNETLFNRTFDSDKKLFIKPAPTAWVDGAKAYQVRTGAYPRRTLLEYSEASNYKDVTGLSKTGKKFLQAIETEMKRDSTKKHVIITFKKLIELESERLTNVHQNLLPILSFHKMEGLDYTEQNITFWVLGTPDVNQSVVEQRTKIFYGNDTEPLDFERDDSTRQYTDTRTQLCWENEVTARLIQAVGRGRLNRKANTFIVFSNVLIPDFTSKAIGFVIEDLEVAGGLENLTDTAQARLDAENEIRTTENPNAHSETRDDLAKERQRKRELKARQKEQAIKMFLAGDTIQKITETLNIHRNSVRLWIKERSKNLLTE